MFLIKKAKIDEGGRLHGAKIKLCVTLGKTPRQTATMVKGVGKLPKVSWSFVYITVWKTYVWFLNVIDSVMDDKKPGRKE